MSAKDGSSNGIHKSSAEILDEIFRELKEKSAKGELPSQSDISVVLGNTLANAEDEHHKNAQQKKKKDGKHKHGYKHKKHKKRKKKLRHSSSSSVEEWVPAEPVISNNHLINIQSASEKVLDNDALPVIGKVYTVSLPNETRSETDCEKQGAIAVTNLAVVVKAPESPFSSVISNCNSSSPQLNTVNKSDLALEEWSLKKESETKKRGFDEVQTLSAVNSSEVASEKFVSQLQVQNSNKRRKCNDENRSENSAVVMDKKIQAEGPVIYNDSHIGEDLKNNKERNKTSKKELNSKSKCTTRKNEVSHSKSSKSADKKLKHKKSASKREDKTQKNKKHPSSRSRTVHLVSRSHSRSRHSYSPSVAKKKSCSGSQSKISRSKSNSPHPAPFLTEKSPSGSKSRGHRSGSRTRRRTSRSSSKETNLHGRKVSSRSRWRRSLSSNRSTHVVIFGEKIDKAKLLEIARKNAMAMMTEGKLPVPLTLEKPEPEKISVKTTGKTVKELTDFCKLLSKKEKEEGECSDDDASKQHHSSDEEEKGTPFVHHPFKLREHQPNIIMNIRNAVQLPVKTPAEKAAESVKLRMQFPVSSGTQHRKKEWIPVSPKKESVTEQEKTKPTEPAYQEPEPAETPSVDIGTIVSQRLKAVRKLMENPHDVEALGQMYNSQQQMQYWAQSKQLPGQYTGTTDVQLLTPEELAGPAHLQAWVKKDQFNRAAPVQGGFGMYMLQKMGWKPGEGLGKNKEGTAEPLILDIKTDKKGLLSQGEIARRCGAPLAKDLSGKHPVSALVELCNKRHWLPPEFILVHDSGPDHKKNFVFKVRVNGQEYQPTIASPNKKHAKAQASTVCLQTLGLVPRDLNNPL